MIYFRLEIKTAIQDFWFPSSNILFTIKSSLSSLKTILVKLSQPPTSYFHYPWSIPSDFSKSHLKQVSFVPCPESHQFLAISDWEEQAPILYWKGNPAQALLGHVYTDSNCGSKLNESGDPKPRWWLWPVKPYNSNSTWRPTSNQCKFRNAGHHMLSARCPTASHSVHASFILQMVLKCISMENALQQSRIKSRPNCSGSRM